MSVLDVEALLKPISDEAPCGEDLRYDARYSAVMRLSEGKPEQQIGDQIIPAEEPDWREVRDGCLDLFLGSDKKTKDLRLSMLLMLAAMRLGKFEGLRDGLTVVSSLLENQWEQFHPKLDPDDGNDPTERVMIIGSLAVPPGSFGDPMRFQDRVREIPIVESRMLGRVGLREIMIATGELPPPTDPNTPKLDSAAVEAVFEEAETDALTAIATLIDECVALVQKIEDVLTAKVGAGKSIDLSTFRTVIADAAKQVRKRLAKRGVAVGDAGGDAVGGGGGGGGGMRLAGDVASRDDVENAIEKVVRYYDEREPSSPVPLLLIAAKMLVGKKFSDIYRILPPDAVAMLERITAPPEQSSSS